MCKRGEGVMNEIAFPDIKGQMAETIPLCIQKPKRFLK
jgi:hypothetical protein